MSTLSTTTHFTPKMAFDPRHAAIHEAAHAVVLWLVGWNAYLTNIQMRRIDGGVELPAMKAALPVPDSLSAIRSTLLVLFAGSAASSDSFGRFMRDIDKDWLMAAVRVSTYFGGTTLRSCTPLRIGFDDPEADALVQESVAKANSIVRDSRIKTTIDVVATLLINAIPDHEGICVVHGAQVIEACERACGRAIKVDNPWTAWIAGL